MKIFFTKAGLLLALFLLMGSYAFAQVPDPFVMTDFEPGTPAGNLTTDPPGPPGWNKNGTNVPQIVANPDKSGINVSNTVMLCVRNVGDVAWVGPKIDDGEWGTVFADTWGGPISGYSYMHIKMYCNKAISPHVNVQAGGSEPGPMGGGMVTTTNAWVDVVFNISDCSAVERILIMFDSTDQDSEVYLDDVTLSNDPTPITTGTEPPIETPDPFVICNFEAGTPDVLMSATPPNGWGYNGSPAQIVANPDPSGINTSSTVIYSIRTAGTGENGCDGSDGGSVNWTGPKLVDDWGTVFHDVFGGLISGYKYMHIKMYANHETQPAIAVGCGDTYPMDGIVITPYTWVDVVFDVSNCDPISQIVIMIDKSCPMMQDSEVYMDDIILTNNPTPEGINNVKGSDVSIYAANGILYVSGSKGAVTVYNVQGQTVYKNASTENLSLGLAKGLYFVKAGAVIKKVLVQ